MPRTPPEWIGKTDDTPVPPRVRLRVFDRFKGICQLSKRKITPPADKWECHHVKELVSGENLNRESNLVPALVAPHKAETKRQMALKKKVNNTRKKHLGIAPAKKKIESRGFSKKATNPKPSLPPRKLFRSVSHG